MRAHSVSETSRAISENEGISRYPKSGYEAWNAWDKLFSYGDEKAHYFAGETRDLAISGATGLEIGFGSGDFLKWAQDRGAKVAGTEINSVLLDAARINSVELLPDDFETIAEQQVARFETIIAFDVFEHFIWTRWRRLDAAGRMLKPGGHMAPRFPNAQSPFGLVPQHGDPTHRSYLSRSVIEHLLQDSKLTVSRYGPFFRLQTGRAQKRVVRALRYWFRDAISAVFNTICATNIPWDPIVVLRKL